MNYQITGNKATGDNTMFGNFNINAGGTGNGKSGLFGGNSVGDVLACTLIQGGKEPVLDLNGVSIKTHATEELSNAKPGDTVYLKIQSADAGKVSLKMIGLKEAPEGMQMSAATSAQVMNNTEQMSEMIKDNLDGSLDEKEAKENQKQILRSISSEELAQLKMMQIDVTNATLSDLMGMVVTLRSGEHRQEVNDQLGDIVKETIGKLRNELMAGTEPTKTSTADVSGNTADNINDEDKGINRLNSEGYVVKVRAPKANVGAAFTGATQTGQTSAFGDIKVSEEQMIYLIRNGMKFTIDNVDVAKNSVNEESPSAALPLDEKVWNDIYPQVTSIIESAGMSVSEQSLSGAKFMLSHELPITVDSLRMYMAINSLNQRGITEAQLAANITEQIAMGNPPENARIIGPTLNEKAQQFVEKVQAITARSVDMAINQGKPVTISYLYNSSMRNVDVKRMRTAVNTGVEGASLSLSAVDNDSVAEGAGVPLSNNPMAVSARRQLEEIRLSMTLEAANRLVRQDFNIDARPLSAVVEMLRNQENTLYENVVSSHDIHDIPEDVDLVKETLKETEALKSLPAYAMADVVRRPGMTVGGLYERASHLKMTLAGQAYETMMTKPRQDMGDSINDAFRNVDEILADMNMDRNRENQRAIRILAYNEMELSPENIASVKTVDAKVQQMFETLTPQIVLNLIRENKNPLNMTIDGLNQEISAQRDIRGITDEQRFSEFLYQLDKNGNITKEERTSFIGIYRLLDKIEKSHGKDIGAIVRNGQEVTLANLFSADKSRQVRGMDVRVNDNFGERVDVATDNKSILDQINTAYNETLAGSILRHIQPETLMSMDRTSYMNMSFEELNNIMKAGFTKEGQLDLSDQLESRLADALSYEEDVATMLEANDMPGTVTNIIAAQQVMYGEDGIFGMVRDLKRGLSKEARERITEREGQVLETLESKENVMYAMENIRAELSREVHAKETDGTITAKDIQSLKYINAGMPIALRSAENDAFSVPLIIGDEVSIMKVSILRDGSYAGEVRTSVDTAHYGKLEAFVRVSNNQVEGYITTEQEAGQRKLEENELTLRSSLAKAGMEVKDLRLDGTRPVQYIEDDRQAVETSKLYQVAKQLLTAVKLMGVVSDN
ncbi:MAG: flagellar hook-length control protein FliK [Lachnospiraceae bacterium]|nr:flagellar hook-length control protein FliK [Lachnospiraceae bacterium]